MRRLTFWTLFATKNAAISAHFSHSDIGLAAGPEIWHPQPRYGARKGAARIPNASPAISGARAYRENGENGKVRQIEKIEKIKIEKMGNRENREMRHGEIEEMAKAEAIKNRDGDRESREMGRVGK